ncbi:cation:proton antiporter [Micromonospora endophytica]|uniref:cation:proton antiporter n=1 Tax=Micromonospora endophytica TaxID=515350 RepID=UPI001C31FD87|nr:cation:proton antiporter [Micromonospora endophytica]BCJ61768.1 hypothetical protein Jiend_51900 [Micromonospora endophytica]
MIRRVLKTVSRSPEPGVVAATVTVLLLLSAAGTHALGLEAILGTFVAGILIGTYPLREEQLAPLRTCAMSVLAPIFFATAGLRIDLTALARPPVALAAVAVILLAIIAKTLGAYLGARLCHLGHWHGLALGAGLNARGVVEIVVAMVGLNLGVISGDMYTVIVLMALITSLTAPPALRFAVRRMPPQRPRAAAAVLAGRQTRA